MTCRYEGCNTRAQYGFVGRTVGTRCSAHREKDMINLSRKCHTEGCVGKAKFRKPRESRSTACLSHRQFGMISRDSFRCPGLGCDKKDQMFIHTRNKIGCCYFHRTVELPPGDIFFSQIPGWKSSIEFQENFLTMEPISFHLQPVIDQECEPGVNCLGEFWLGKSWEKMYCKFHFLSGVESESQMEVEIFV